MKGSTSNSSLFTPIAGPSRKPSASHLTEDWQQQHHAGLVLVLARHGTEWNNNTLHPVDYLRGTRMYDDRKPMHDFLKACRVAFQQAQLRANFNSLWH